jgi:hypothetical protein
LLCFRAFLLLAALPLRAQTNAAPQFIDLAQYSVLFEPGNPPQIKLQSDRQIIFQMPMVAGLASSTSEEQLSDFTYHCGGQAQTAWS